MRKVRQLTRWARELEWTAAGELRPGDKVVLHDHREAPQWAGARTEAEGYLLGLLLGDGTLKADKAVLSVWRPAQVANGEAACAGVDGVMEAALAAAQTCRIGRTSSGGSRSKAATSGGCRWAR